MLVPVTQLIGTCSSSRTLSTPTCARPRAPPPESASPMVLFDAGAPDAACDAEDGGVWIMGAASAAKACEPEASDRKAIAATNAAIRNTAAMTILPLGRA